MISPVLWAFSRDDSESWTTIYKMDRGIDSGPVYKQFIISIKEHDLAFSLYERVYLKAGKELVNLLKNIKNCELCLQYNLNRDTYHSCPNEEQKIARKKNRKSFIKAAEIIRLIKYSGIFLIEELLPKNMKLSF